jgi:glycosyltransferase involved in cell wall biosynthesis
VGLSSESVHDFRLVTLPDRFWKWRMQGAAVSLARTTIDAVSGGYLPDVLFASSMVNVPAYVALTRDAIPRLPIVLYMHENQLTYVQPDGGSPDYTYAFINYLSCLTADEVVFNSEFHRSEFLGALAELLKRFPDQTHGDPTTRILSKSSVLHLGIDADAIDAQLAPRTAAQASDSTPAILWNHRWEYDKNPESFFRVLNRLDDAGLAFDLILIGEDFENRPTVFDEAQDRYGSRILQYGFVPSFDEYCTWLDQADLVVSTANHEFFGISTVEAIHCGCHPLVPNRLSYPEILGSPARPPAGKVPILYETEDQLYQALVSLLSGEMEMLSRSTLRGLVVRFDWKTRAPEFDAMLDRVAGVGKQGRGA